jgi:hypothetical protein
MALTPSQEWAHWYMLHGHMYGLYLAGQSVPRHCIIPGPNRHESMHSHCPITPRNAPPISPPAPARFPYAIPALKGGGIQPTSYTRHRLFVPHPSVPSLNLFPSLYRIASCPQLAPPLTPPPTPRATANVVCRRCPVCDIHHNAIARSLFSGARQILLATPSTRISNHRLLIRTATCDVGSKSAICRSVARHVNSRQLNLRNLIEWHRMTWVAISVRSCFTVRWTQLQEYFERTSLRMRRDQRRYKRVINKDS